MSQIDSITIDEKYNGPDGSGNGGYVAGRIAAHVDSDVVEVTLRRPPPLGREMSVVDIDGQVQFLDKGQLVASARRGVLDLEDIPEGIDMALARECSSRYPGFERHPFPHCYVCGTDRKAGDGLRIYSGLSKSGQYVAAPFDTFEALYDENGYMREEHVWAALDCPGSYAINALATPKVMVLGRITASIVSPIDRDMGLVSLAWYLGTEGKKNYSGSAIYSAGGALLALAKATWIEVDPAVFYSDRQ